MIATMLLGTTVLAIMAYNNLNPKEPESKQEQPQVEAKQEPSPQPKRRTHWVFPQREKPTTVRIIVPQRDGGFTVRTCMNFECQ
jgi:hypothetical protein